MAVKSVLIIKILLFLPLDTYQSSETNDGLFTSSTDLQNLVITQTELVTKLHKYLEEEASRLDKLQRVVKQYENLRDNAAQSGDKFVGNPLNSYLLIKRLTSDWKTLQVGLG